MPTFVRYYGNSLTGTNVTVATLTGVTLTAGDVGVVLVTWGEFNLIQKNISSFADSLGNTWNAVPNTLQIGTGNLHQGVLYASAITNGGSGVTITVNFTGAVSSAGISGAEFNGGPATVDVSAGNAYTGNGSVPTLPTITPQSGELVYGYIYRDDNNPIGGSPGAGWTSPGSIGTTFGAQMYALVSSGSYVPNVGNTVNTVAYFGGVVAFGSPPPINKSYNNDAFVSPAINNRSFNNDVFVLVPAVSHGNDCYIANPSGITVSEGYVKLAGSILFKINPSNGYVRLNSTINQPVRSFVQLLATVKAGKGIYNPPLALAGTIKTKSTPSYVKLNGTISNPTLRTWRNDCVVTSPTRTFVNMIGTLIQPLAKYPQPPKGSYPDSSYVRFEVKLQNPPGVHLLGVGPLSGGANDSIQMPGSGFTTDDDWYSSNDALAAYKILSIFNLSGANLPAGGINLVVSAFTIGPTSFQTRTRSWLRRVDAAPSGIVVNTQTNTHTLPNGAVITTTTVTTQNQDTTTTAVTTQSSATPTRSSTVITEKQVGGQTKTREIDTTTINGITTNVEKKTVFSVPPTYDNPQPLKVVTLDGVVHYQFFTAINTEWAGGDAEGVTNTNTQVQIVPGVLNGQTVDQFGNPIMQKITASTQTTPDGKIITTTTSETGSAITNTAGTTTIDTTQTFVGLQVTTLTTTNYPDGSQLVVSKSVNPQTGDSTQTDTETVTDEYGQVTTTVTSTDTKTFVDPTSGLNRQQITKTVSVTKGGVTTVDTQVISTNDYEDSIVNQKVKVYFIQEFTITCIIDELNLFALSDLNITLQKNYTLLELFGQQLSNTNLSWVMRNKLINQFNQANSAISPFTLQALGKLYSVVFAQSASAFRAKYIPGAEPHVYELQLILQTRSDIATGAFGF